MFHSRAMMEFKMHTTLSNYCRALFFESANELPRAYEHACKVLETLSQVRAAVLLGFPINHGICRQLRC